MKKPATTAFAMLLIVFSISCGVESQKENLVPEQGVNIITTYHYNIALSKKELSPTNFTIKLDTVIIREKNDTWYYSVTEILANTPEQFEANLMGGNISIGDNHQYKIKIQDGVVITTRLSNNARWFDVTEEMIPSFEKALDDQGLIFHRSY